MADEYVLERVFDAPRALVWRTWSEPELLARWYGPGVETIIHEFDLRPGGVWKNEMRMKSMSDMSKMEFQEVIPGEKIVWHHYSTDAEWNVQANPMMPDWPRMLLTTVTFEDRGDKTMVRLVWEPERESRSGAVRCDPGRREAPDSSAPAPSRSDRAST